MKKINLSTRSVLIVTIILGIMCGLAVLYAMNPLPRNTAMDNRCVTTPAMLEAMRTKAVGEMAGVIVPDAPKPLPDDWTFQNDAGEILTLANLRAKTLVLNLWASWCVPCREEMPALDRLQGDMGNDFFEVVAVSVDLQGTEKAKAFLNSIGVRNMAFYQSPDGKLFQQLQKAGRAVGLPTSLIIDASGCEIGYLPGPADWAHPDARALLKAVRGE